MGSYTEELDKMLAEYEEELELKKRDLEQFERQQLLTVTAIADLENAIARLRGFTSAAAEEAATPPLVQHIDRYVSKRRTRSDWLDLIRREFPGGKEFSAQALASASSASVDGAYTAAENLRKDGYLQRRGGRDDPSQHEVLWSLKQPSDAMMNGRPEPFNSPH